MKPYIFRAHAATDVTGFGILGHSKNLAEFQKAEIDFKIHTLPVLSGTARVTEELVAKGGRNFRYVQPLGNDCNSVTIL